MLTLVIYFIALCVGMGMVGLSLASYLYADFQFWPPPSTRSWQHHTFRALFRVFFLGLVILSVVDFHGPQSIAWQYLIGFPLFVLGFGFALYWTNFLGWRNAFGEARGLKTDGAYQWSRVWHQKG